MFPHEDESLSEANVKYGEQSCTLHVSFIQHSITAAGTRVESKSADTFPDLLLALEVAKVLMVKHCTLGFNAVQNIWLSGKSRAMGIAAPIRSDMEPLAKF